MTTGYTEQRINWQKWKLATTIFAIYWPIRLYVHIDKLTPTFLHRVWPLWIIEIIVTILFFGLWLSVTNWIQQRLTSQMHREFLIEFDLPAQLLTLLIAGILASLFNVAFYKIWEFMMGAPDGRIIPWMQYHSRLQGQKFDDGLTIMAMLSAFYLAANHRGYQRLEDVRVKAEQLKYEATQAQFAALKNQVNPHFLFNSLSILSSLILVNPKLSIQFVGQLAKAYRYVLEQRNAVSIRLNEELNFLNAFAFLLHIRFSNKLSVLVDIPPEVADTYKIAPLTLQLLVENAVKHNQMSDENPLLVHIRVNQNYLTVSNSILRRVHVQPSTGLGLKNITDRYRLLTSRSVQVSDGPTDFVVKIPLLV